MSKVEIYIIQAYNGAPESQKKYKWTFWALVPFLTNEDTCEYFILGRFRAKEHTAMLP